MMTSIGNVRILPIVKVGRARDSSGDGEHWRAEEVAPTVNLFDIGDARSVVLVLNICKCT